MQVAHTPASTGKQQQCLRIYWESRVSNNSTATRCVHLCMSAGANWRGRSNEGEDSGAEKARDGVKVELRSKQKLNTTHTAPVSGQLNHQESGKIPSPPSTNSSQKPHQYDFTVADLVV